MLKPGLIDFVRDLVDRARESGRSHLFESEGYEILDALGFDLPRRVLVRGANDPGLDEVEGFSGSRVVLKLVSAFVQHKTEVGGVRILSRGRATIRQEITALQERFPDAEGFLLCEFLPHEQGFGRELLLGFRDTADFGPVVSLGSGGTAAEFLAGELRPGHEVAILGAGPLGAEEIKTALERTAVARAIIEPRRGRDPLVTREQLDRMLGDFAEFARAVAPDLISEFEINPLVLSEGRLVALDVLAKLGEPAPALPAPRPLDRMKALYEPGSIAVIGASTRMNPGRIILRNIVDAGFPAKRVSVVKPGITELEGCLAVPDLASLPHAVDLLIVALAAEQVPEVLREVIERRAAESLIVIPGGMAEREGGAAIQDEIASLLAAARQTPWGGPIVNGGNCLGIRSRPGRFDTLFIPKWKLPPVEGPESPLALISQSGAFAIARQSWLDGLRPRYLVTFGNQIDLTAADHLEYLARDESVKVYACYVEGFQRGDGERFCRAARKIAARGGRVILYRAGRSPTGARAAASHTASVAGDFVVTRELARQAGIIVAESLEDFDDLVRVATALAKRPLLGRRAGFMSNAGFECVAMADALGPFQLAPFEPTTVSWLAEIFARARLGSIVDIHNPLDVTPIMTDELFAESARAILLDENVDFALIGCVPLSAAIATLPPAFGYTEEMNAPEALAPLLIDLHRAGPKPWFMVVDSGALYDPFARILEEGGIPTFRRSDRALRILALLTAP